MDGFQHAVSDTFWHWKQRYHELDFGMFKSSVSLGIRKLSKAPILIAAFCLSLILFISYPKTQVDFHILGHHQSNQTLDLEHHPHNETLELDLHQSNKTLDQEHPLTTSTTLVITSQPSNHQTTSQIPQSSTQPETARPRPTEPVDKPGQQQDTVKQRQRDRRFVLIIPATSPSPDLCKTIVTALALGYPSPVIINWGIDYHQVTKWEGGQNLPKIPGFVKYLDGVMHPDAHPDEKLDEEDLVLMVDAYDVWFQLPAEILLRRYHEINKKANARLHQQWNKSEPMPMLQTVIAASGKNCHPQPDSGSNMHCERLPDSPLRPDLYGPDTEKNATKHRDHRPKYINGGVYIGPAGDMRRLFRRAAQKMEAGIGQGVHLFSEQGIPGEVLGEQEVWRQWRRGSNDVVSDNDARVLMDRDFEYHFGLDYHQELSIQTFWTDTEDGLFDGAFVRLNNQTVIDGYSAALGISPVRLKGVPNDVQTARNPLSGIVESPDWGGMPLYADFYTESVPVIVHHNGFKERRTSWWHKPWFHQHLRQLLTLSLVPKEPSASFAVVEAEDGIVKYWGQPAGLTDRRPRLMGDSAKGSFAKMEFQDVCQYPDESARGEGKHWWDEVFRDTEGPFS